MKIPKFIEKALNDRVSAATKFNNADLIISEWCDKNGIYLESHDCYGGVESLVNPYESAERISQAIRSKI